MKTTSVMLQTLCVPCACRCRYCLLSWSGQTVGADYVPSAAYARRFAGWLRENRPALDFNFSFGYSMDHPRLLEAVDFLRELGSVGAKFLQFDGMGFRSGEEMQALLAALREHGVEQLNFTFYGTREYHDRFAARQGDFDFMLTTARAAQECGLEVSAGVPVNRENAGQMDALLAQLADIGMTAPRLFVPHGEGRGAALEGVRLTQAEYRELSETAKARLNSAVYKPEGEWLRERAFQEPENRALLISLTRENLGRLEAMPFDSVIVEAEALDEAYYNALPPREELAARYGDPEGQAYYSQRDLFHRYQRQYIHEKGLRLYDVTDERQTGSRRF